LIFKSLLRFEPEERGRRTLATEQIFLDDEEQEEEEEEEEEIGVVVVGVRIVLRTEADGENAI
jgi:hypothetical protein